VKETEDTGGSKPQGRPTKVKLHKKRLLGNKERTQHTINAPLKKPEAKNDLENMPQRPSTPQDPPITPDARKKKSDAKRYKATAKKPPKNTQN